MKIKLAFNIFIVALVSFFLGACKTNHLPKVQNPTYQPYSYGDERGYTAKFTLSKNSPSPIAIIINNIEQAVGPDAAHANDYSVNVIAQSRRLLGFKAKKTNRENGIIFKTDSAEVFKKVNFKLISK